MYGFKRIKILGIPVDAVTQDKAVEVVADFLHDKAGQKVFTPNPEMLVMARDRPLFREALQSSDLSIPDGAGLLWAARLLGKDLPTRVTGTDMVSRVCGLAAEDGYGIFMLGGRPGVAEKAADRLRAEFPGLRIVGAMSGGQVKYDEEGAPIMDYGTERALNLAVPDILFVAFGHGKQEEWIHTHLQKFPSVRVALGVGGAFDFISGESKRAPDFMQRIDLEWLWRLVLQPWRIGRILTATVVFPLLVLGERLGIVKTELKSLS
ncbi:MAG: WecB/TagA/CpsF family glycosyltransferase [Patescibacteria group bacterium]|nr:WecB/TagA/CpsF family glycosyltransferase [Patescibacteria group bacterium]